MRGQHAHWVSWFGCLGDSFPTRRSVALLDVELCKGLFRLEMFKVCMTYVFPGSLSKSKVWKENEDGMYEWQETLVPGDAQSDEWICARSLVPGATKSFRIMLK